MRSAFDQLVKRAAFDQMRNVSKLRARLAKCAAHLVNPTDSDQMRTQFVKCTSVWPIPLIWNKNKTVNANLHLTITTKTICRWCKCLSLMHWFSVCYLYCITVLVFMLLSGFLCSDSDVIFYTWMNGMTIEQCHCAVFVVIVKCRFAFSLFYLRSWRFLW